MMPCGLRKLINIYILREDSWEPINRINSSAIIWWERQGSIF